MKNVPTDFECWASLWIIISFHIFFLLNVRKGKEITNKKTLFILYY